MKDESISGFEIPLHTSLTQPVLIGGVPRNLMILNIVLTLFAALGLKVWHVAVPLGIVVHVLAVVLTRHDPDWFAVFRRHLKQPAFLDA